MDSNILYKLLICILIIVIFIIICKITLNSIINTKINDLYEINKYKIHINKLDFLKNICENIDFYKKNNPVLEELPIITKKMISTNPELFYNKKIPKIENSTDSANNSWTQNKIVKKDISYLDHIKYVYYLLNGHSIAQITGGTSGNYFYQWYSYDDMIRGCYGFTKCWINMGWVPNDKIFLYYFHGANSVKLLNKITALPYFIENIYSLSPVLNNNGDIIEESLNEFIGVINNYKPDLIISFPSIIFRMCQLIHKNNIKMKHIPKCMDLSADFLFTCQYNFICSIFVNCDIRMSYGTIEFGQIAQQIPGKMFDYIVFDDIVYVENDNNNNLIVTNYLYETQPIIRYLTDDKGFVEYKDEMIIIKNLTGKQNDYNYIFIDSIINDSGYNIINFRIDNMNIYITILDRSDNNIILYFRKFFKDYNVILNTCNEINCTTYDRYDRKNTPILNQYYYDKK
jgi:hypothetical protein